MMQTTFDPSRPRGLPRPHTCLWADSLVGSVADGADVDVEWPNLGTNAFTGVTATASTRRPTMWHSVANGHPALEFDGTQDLMKSSWFFSPDLNSAVEPYTFVAVVLSRGASLSADQYVFDSWTSSDRNYLYCKGAGFEDEWYFGSNARGTRHPGEWDLIHSIQRINTEGLSEVTVNNEQGVDASYGATSFAGWTVGGRYSTQSFLDGYLALLMCFEGDPAADYPDAWQRFLAEIASYYSIPSYTAPAQDDQRLWVPPSDMIAWYHPGSLVESGGVVTSWDDASASGFDIPAHSGVVTTATCLGRRVAVFDGSSRLRWAGAGRQMVNASSGEWTALAVGLSSATGYRNLWDGDSGAGSGRVAQFIRQSNATPTPVLQSIGFGTSPFTDSGGSATLNEWHVFAARLSVDGLDALVDGVSNGVTAGIGAYKTELCTKVSIGTYGGESQLWSGLVGEIVHYDRALSDAELRRAINYLGMKWKASVLL